MGRNSAFAFSGLFVSFFLGAFAASSHAQQLMGYHEILGDSAGDQLGYSLAGIGDVNDDGVPDFAIGSNQDTTPQGVIAGSVKIYSGKTGALLRTIFGDALGDQLGFSLAAAGDVDKDGAGDVLVGAPFYDAPGKLNAGIAKLISGRTGAILLTLQGLAANDQFGFSVAGTGDANQDSYPDLLVSANRTDVPLLDMGTVTLFSGLNGSVLRTWNADSSGDQFGFSVAGPGDVNLDGFPDVLVGIPFDDGHGLNSGSAKLFSGKDGSVLFSWSGGSSNDNFGIHVAGAGDTNYDGYPELLLGASRENFSGVLDVGSVTVASGKTGVTLSKYFGDAANDQLGLASAGIGDLNQDGAADILVGIRLASVGSASSAGKAKIFSGATGTQLFTIDGELIGDQFGFSVAKLGDLNADGSPEFLIGSAAADPAGANSGKARVMGLPYQEPIQGVLQDIHTIGNHEANAGVWFQLERAGDYDGDQIPDILTGNPFEGPIDQDGVVRVLSGKDYSELLKIEAPSLDERFGQTIAQAGDVNGDGKLDYLVAAESSILANYADHLRVISGADGSTIHYYSFYPHISDLESLGDLSGDGRPDFAVGFNLLGSPGRVEIYSGASGSLITYLQVSQNGADFGRCIHRLGDVNADGKSDFLVSAPNFGNYAGRITLFSGADFAPIFWVDGAPGDRLGASLGAVGDFNGDGVEDFVAGAYDYDPLLGIESGGNYIRVISGSDGATLLQVDGNIPGNLLGKSVEGVGDRNGDGISDLVASFPLASVESQIYAGIVRVYSGADGSVLNEWFGSADYGLGDSVRNLGDLDGDGVNEIGAGIPGFDTPFLNGGGVRIYRSFDKASFVAKKTNTLSLSAGGSQQFQIGVSGPVVGKMYLVLGSSSGTTPGIPVGLKTLPLNWDDYLSYTLSNPLGPTMSGGFGFFGSSGAANPTLTLPPGLSPSLLGLTVHHAFLIFSVGGGIEFASNPVPLKFVP